jgi:hypothetical protein
MPDCRLKRNRENPVCMKKYRNLSWSQAKRKFPHLKAKGDADSDKVINKKDCRPFNKKKHTLQITDEGGNKEVYISHKQYQAFKIIRYGKELGLPPKETHEELKEHKISSEDMRVGLSAYLLSNKGAKVYEGEGLYQFS